MKKDNMYIKLKWNGKLLALTAMCLLICGRILSQDIPPSVDICIYGGTSAGVIAAYTARLQGRSVLLIEPGSHLGGLTTGGLGYTDIGNKFAVTGLARDFYRKVGTHYGKLEQWIFEPHVAEDIFGAYIRKASVPVLYHYRIVSITKSGTAIEEIILENSDKPDGSTNKRIRAKQFIDCSYEGDLMARAGVSYTVGRESNATYHETYNGVQVLDKHQFPEGIDPYKIPGDPRSGLLWGISAEQPASRGSGDKKVQAYNFRICLTSDLKNKIPIGMPAGYDSTRYELLIRLLEKQPKRPFNLIFKPDIMPGQKTDINNNGPFSTDMIGMNYDYPEASYERREAIIKEHANYIKGLLYFVGHSSRMPNHLKQEMLRWGYPKDEYVDSEGWSPQMYVREARRMVGEYVMTQSNCEGKEVVKDGVGMAAYTMDSHNVQRLVVDGVVKNEGDVQVGGFPPYPISFRSLIPRSTECTNLMVPVCLSATHIAYGSIRMEPVFMVLAQSSAIAASMAIEKNTPVQKIDVAQLQQRLLRDPLSDGGVAEILVDNEDKSNIEVTGSWATIKNAKGCYGLSLLMDTTVSRQKKEVRFMPTIQKEGLYKVYAYFPAIEGGAGAVTVIIKGAKETTVVVHPNEIKIEGQTAGEWVSIGEFTFPKGRGASVAITNIGADGKVVADAVLFIPRRD